MKRKHGEWTRGLAAAGIAAALCMTAVTLNAQEENKKEGRGSASASEGAEGGAGWSHAVGDLKEGLSKQEDAQRAHKCKGERIYKCPGHTLRKPEKPSKLPKKPTPVKPLKPGKIKEDLKDALKGGKAAGKGGGSSGEDSASKGAYGQLRKGGAEGGGEIPEIEKAGPVELPPGVWEKAIRKGASGGAKGTVDPGAQGPAPDEE